VYTNIQPIVKTVVIPVSQPVSQPVESRKRGFIVAAVKCVVSAYITVMASPSIVVTKQLVVEFVYANQFLHDVA